MNKTLGYVLVAGALMLPLAASAGVYDDMLTALRSGDNGAVVALLDRGVDVNTVDRNGDTLLMLAVRENNAELLDQLLLRRARLNSRNRNGDTALRLAAFAGQEAFVHRLVEAGAAVNMYGWTPLAYAAYNGHASIVDYLLKRGAEIDARTENGSTALMVAARNGHQAVVEVLLQHHANPNLVNENNDAALDWAERSGNTQIAALLRAAGGHAGSAIVIELAPHSTAPAMGTGADAAPVVTPLAVEENVAVKTEPAAAHTHGAGNDAKNGVAR
ncbi:ankyrin repeat domain-containing protein [Rhodocyclus tenuis]|uniref:Ankyrin repeat domain-containing protein n=2 Tax=Rhodocyclus TaxID=1064 RepID=A0A6L5JUB7_RHOTE|nr:ankyrin repeat domain-containing protein [Rhodocyclus gracilis]MQY50819.1 ankyrin repeat domain-containing protein [Rhodocyclus gracilis]MRD72817.1 ankyrin repeat domain-containing protein [Rhodocyclus gracilis]NJA87615.1 ankyrin repeat domain-containing protein [Rhodocyclus gracilis]